MIAGLFKLLDWTAIRLAEAKMPKPDGRDPHLAEARELIGSPAFLSAKVEAADVQFIDGERFQFQSPYPGHHPINSMAHGRLYRCGESWRERPTVILMHGWNDVINHTLRFPMMSRQFNRSGFNAATLTAPFHFQRRPRHLGAWGNFLCPDILRMVEAVRQAVAETRAFAQWLREQGCPGVGLFGVSLGGCLAGLTICHDAGFACAVLLVPAASLDKMLEEAFFFRGIREALKGEKAPGGKLNLTENVPVIPRENVLLIEALYDLFVPVAAMEELWRHWREPEIWRLRQGHISVLAAPGLSGRIIGWMSPRLLAHGATETGSR